MIVVDTHALLWWILEPDRLSSPARAVIEREPIGVAAITCWEVALLEHRRRITLHYDVTRWLREVLALPRMELLPLTIEIAVAAATMPIAHRDPADRQIIATALHHNAALVTTDEKIRAANVVETIW